MQELQERITEVLASTIASGALDEMIKAKLTKTIDDVLDNLLRSWSPLGKAIEKELQRSLAVDLDLGLGGYNELVASIVKQRIQDRTVSIMIRAGYQTATVAKLLETAHKAQAEGKAIDQQLYDKAKEFYEDAFYRVLFIGAENSIGFHNPAEGLRILGDSIAFGSRAEAYLRQALTKAGVDVPVKIDLEIMKYTDQRGTKKLKFDPTLDVKDPYGLQDKFF